MNDLNSKSKGFVSKKLITKGGRFMLFLQGVATVVVLLGLFTTLYYPLENLRMFFKASILMLSALVSLGLLFYNEKYRLLWRDFDSPEAFDPMIFTFGYFIYGFALFLCVLTFWYFRTTKKNKDHRGYAIYSLVLFIITIILMIVHTIVKNKYM